MIKNGHIVARSDFMDKKKVISYKLDSRELTVIEDFENNWMPKPNEVSFFRLSKISKSKSFSYPNKY